MFKAFITVLLILLLVQPSTQAFSQTMTPVNPSPIITGYSYEHTSNNLKQKRRYMVSLPESYYASKHSYPTLYVIDADFQFQHTSALVTNLTRMGKIAPMIVVGIANQGTSDYVYTTTWPAENNKEFGGANSFYQYITQELLPTIEKDFRTNKQKALAGYSLGGLFASYAMMQEDTPFTAFLAMSPSAWFDDYALADKLSKYLIKEANIAIKPTKPLPHFFISIANEEGMGVDKVVEKLKKQINRQKKLKQWHWQFKSYPEETHFSTALPALYDALVFLSPNYYVDPQDMMKLNSYSEVIALFKQKKQNWAGFRIEWLQAYQLAKYMFWSKQTDEIDELLIKIKQHFPESVTEVAIQMATGFNKKQKTKQALALLSIYAKEGKNHTMWYKEMSVAYTALNKQKLASEYQQKALALAKQQQLSSWQVWELQ